MTGNVRNARDPVGRARVATITGVAGVILLVAVVPWIVPPTGASSWLVVPVALGGIVVPVAGYRTYLAMVGRIEQTSSPERRGEGLRRATVTSLSLTGCVAAAGIVVYALTRDPAALSGAVAHVLLAGAVWPTAGRVEALVGERRPEG